MPFSKAALDESVLSLVGTKSVKPWGGGELCGVEYKDWKKWKSVAVNLTVAYFLDGISRSKMPNVHYDSPLPFAPTKS